MTHRRQHLRREPPHGTLCLVILLGPDLIIRDDGECTWVGDDEARQAGFRAWFHPG
jgi:hypothetical protein